MAFCGLRKGFRTFYCFKCLEKRELIFCVILNSFKIIFPIDGKILKKTRCDIVLWCAMEHASSFIFVMNESKYDRILKVKGVVS